MSQSCTPFTLPSGGVLTYSDDSVVTLTADLVFQPQCTDGYVYPGCSDLSSVTNVSEPFYSSTIPQTYVVACTTIIAWVLVTMLTINPRTFYMGGIGTNFASGRGLIGGATGANSGPGVGSRPWLQKVAALAVAVSMTIATADTFKVAENQYDNGYMDATAMRDQVEGSLEIRIVRVISDIFLWLAQVQTLIRLFPRHKEKVMIKWIGFALIVLDTTFSCLNSFLVDNVSRPRHYVDAIPALCYLFELAVGLLYAAWVIFYGVTKRRYAYYHRRMKNICLVALLSHIAILTPVVFFVTDVSEPDVAAWGDYFRWVGAAAASVVVWEWVERIEALERDEKKDGILGREIFDGDEMLDYTHSQEMTYTRKPRDEYRPASSAGGNEQKKPRPQIRDLFRRRQPPQISKTHFPLGRSHSHTMDVETSILAANTNIMESRSITFGHLPRPEPATSSPTSTTDGPQPTPTPPPPRVTPPSRTDTTSAASTVYVVNYDGSGDPGHPQPVRRRAEEHLQSASRRSNAQAEEPVEASDDIAKPLRSSQALWQSVPNPFKRKRMTPPAEVRAATEAAQRRAVTPAAHSYSKWDVSARLGAFAAEQGEKFRERRAMKTTGDDDDLPWTIIPAQPRGASTWSPSMLDKDKNKGKGSSQPSTQRSSNASPAARDSGASGSGQHRDSNESRQLAWSGTTATSDQRRTDGQPISRPAQRTSNQVVAEPRRPRDSGSTSATVSSEAGPSTTRPDVSVIHGPREE